MPDFVRYPNEGFPYFVTTNLKGRRPLFLEPAHCQTMVGCIQYLRTGLGHRVHAYVIMPDHIHLIITPAGSSNISKAIHSLKLHSARQIDAALGSKGGIWQARFYERALRTTRDIERAVAYVHDNPLQARLAEKPGDYVWSSYRACILGYSAPIGLDPVPW